MEEPARSPKPGVSATKPSPRVLCATGPFYMLPLGQVFEAMSRAGFTAAEVMVTSERESQDPKALRALAEDFGVEVAAVHAPFLLLTRRVFSTDPLEKIKRSTELAQEAGASLVVVHPAFHWQRGYRRWLRTELEEFSAREGVTIAMENMFPLWVRGWGITVHQTTGIEDLKRFPAITLDTSHLAVSGIDIIRAYDELADRVVHIHLSNNLGAGRDSHSPLTQGVLPIGAFLERLAGSGYGGTITLELDIRPWANNPAKLASFLRGNREYCLEKLGVRAGG
jgi:sugar phosphate isomerase/epimerase